MTWRMKIADWISGGELTRLRAELGEALTDGNHWFTKWAGTQVEKSARSAALREIAHMRTPRCASIGKRMADVAEEALK